VKANTLISSLVSFYFHPFLRFYFSFYRPLPTDPFPECPIQLLVPIVKEMRAMPSDTLIVGMTYLEFLAVFRSTVNELRIALVPSEARHSGAIMDRAYDRRRQKEVQRMGWWLATKSVRDP
jgi:hypothetical protein